jgi:dTDP-4-dehydrorhamnose reductase
MSSRIVITGAGGMVGRVLTAHAQHAGHPVAAFTSAQWDITDAGAATGVLQPGDVLVNCAAYTKVDAAEDDPDRAHAVNAVGPANLARRCADAGAGLIHLSTDYVFSGVFGAAPRPYEIDDTTDPRSVYGRTKLAGEQAVLEALPGAFVVRTSWVFAGAPDGTDFVSAMRRAAAGSSTVDVVADQIGSPTSAADLAGALLQIAGGGVRGPLLHVANGGTASRYDQATAVFELLGADPQRVRPVGTDRHPRPAPRPAYSALGSRGTAAAGLAPLRGWRDALAAALAD